MSKEPCDRLREARIKAGFSSPADAAEAFGWNKNTYKSHEYGVRGFSVESAKRYARAFKVSPSWLLTAEEGKALSQPFVETASVPVVGVVQAGAWLESDGPWEGEEESIPVVPDPRYAPHRQWAVLVKGDSVNEVIGDGEFAHCVDIDCGREIKEGDLVVVERVRHQGGLVETTIKEVRQNGKGPELWPRSTNKRHNGPVHLGHEDDEDIEVRIKGFVIGAYRKL